MSYVADDGAWAQRVNQEISLKNKSLLSLMNRRTYSKDYLSNSSKSHQNNSVRYQQRPSVQQQFDSNNKANNNQSFINQQNNLQNNNINQFQDRFDKFNIIKGDFELEDKNQKVMKDQVISQNHRDLVNTEIGQKLIHLNQSQLFNTNYNSIKSLKNLKNIQSGGLTLSSQKYLNNSLGLQKIQERPINNNGSSYRQKNAQNFRNGMNQQLNRTQQNNQVSRPSTKGSMRRQITVVDNESDYVKHPVSQITKPTLLSKPRFNEDADNEILSQRSTTFRSNLTRQNINNYFQNQINEGEIGAQSMRSSVKYSSLRSLKLSHKSKRDMLSNLKSFHPLAQNNQDTKSQATQENGQAQDVTEKLQYDDQMNKRVSDRLSVTASTSRIERVLSGHPSSGNRILRSSYSSRVRGKLIEAINRMDKQKLNEVQHKILDASNEEADDIVNINQLNLDSDEDQDNPLMRIDDYQQDFGLKLDKLTQNEVDLIQNFDIKPKKSAKLRKKNAIEA
eukprot:403353085